MRRAIVLLCITLCCWSLVAAAEDTPEQRQLDFANGLFQRGLYAEAVEEYEKYLGSAAPGEDASTARYRLGESAYAQGQYEKAVTAFDAVLGANPDRTLRHRAALSRGEALYFLKRHEEARAALQPLAAEGDDMQRSRALYYLGRSHTDTGNFQAAAASFRAVIDGFQGTQFAPYAQYHLGFALLAQDKFEDAAVQFSAVAGGGADPETRAESRYRAAQIYDKISWHDAAIDAYQKLINDFPESVLLERARYGLAWALFRGKKTEEAQRAVEAFEKAFPDSTLRVGMRYLVGCCQQQAGEYDAALATFAAVREQYAQTEFGPAAQYRAAWVRYLKGETDAAKGEVQAFLTAHGDSPYVGDAAFLLGTLLVSEGDYEGAQQQFRLVHEKFPESEFGAEALFKAAECLSQLGATSEAAKAFEEFAARYPDNPLTEQAVLRAGDANFNAQAFTEAVEKYRKIIDAAPTPEVERQTLYRLGVTYHNMKDYAKSADIFRKLAEKHGDDPKAGEAWYRVGEHLLREAKDPDKALQAYEAAITHAEKEPVDKALLGKARRGYALAQYERKDYDGAAQAFLQLAQQHPDVPLNEDAYAWAGQRFFDAARWDDASVIFGAMLTALPAYPNPERVLFLIAQCSESAGKDEESLAEYERVVQAAPSSAKAVEASYRMALLHQKLGHTEQAMSMLEQAANANAGEIAAQARFRLGEMHEAQGQFDKAARSFMRVAILFLHPELSPEALWRAGQNFEKAGSLDQARKAYEELLQDYPGHAHASEAQAAISRASAPPVPGAPASSGG